MHQRNTKYAILQDLRRKIGERYDFTTKRLASGYCLHHTEYDKGDMKHEKNRAFPNSGAILQALRVIERETGVPVAVQIRLAHLQWIKQQRKRGQINERTKYPKQ